jgi:hypothetical protein
LAAHRVPPDDLVKKVIPARGRLCVDMGKIEGGRLAAGPWRYVPQEPCIAWLELEDGTKLASRPGFRLIDNSPSTLRFSRQRELVPVVSPEGDADNVRVARRMSLPRAAAHRLWYWRLYTAGTGPYPAEWFRRLRRWLAGRFKGR